MSPMTGLETKGRRDFLFEGLDDVSSGGPLRREILIEAYRLVRLGFVDADLAQAEPKGVEPSEILTTVALADRPGFDGVAMALSRRSGLAAFSVAW